MLSSALVRRYRSDNTFQEATNKVKPDWKDLSDAELANAFYEDMIKPVYNTLDLNYIVHHFFDPEMLKDPAIGKVHGIINFFIPFYKPEVV